MKAALFIGGGILVSLATIGPLATAALLVVVFVGLVLLGLHLS